MCAGSSTLLTASGGGTYAWNNGAVTAANNITTAGTYTVTVTNNGCTSSAQSIVTETTLIVNAGPDRTICGSNNTSIGADPITTIEGATYIWSSGPSGTIDLSGGGQDHGFIFVNSPGTYTVSITSNGCTTTDVVVVTQINVTATISGATTLCSGGSTILTASGGGTYAWSNGTMTAANTVNAANTYTVTVTNNGCTSTGNLRLP